jgi:hypothetical protein
MRGARFYRDGERVAFVRHLDGSTREGPRPATDADRAEHPQAWAQYEATLPAPAKRKS